MCRAFRWHRGPGASFCATNENLEGFQTSSPVPILCARHNQPQLQATAGQLLVDINVALLKTLQRGLHNPPNLATFMQSRFTLIPAQPHAGVLSQE